MARRQGVTRPTVAAGRVSGAESARKVLGILLAFSEDQPRATIQQLAERMGLPSSTTYRYVSLLRDMNLLEEGPASTYQVTPVIAPVARAAQKVNDLATLGHAVMVRVAEEVGETVLLWRQLGDVAVVVDSVEASNVVRLAMQAGEPHPLGYGASPKLLLSQLPKEEQAAYLDEQCRRDPSLGARRAVLERELHQIARQGLAESLGEIDEGIWACAVPIGDGTLRAALSVAGPAYRIDSAARESIQQILVARGRELSERLLRLAPSSLPSGGGRKGRL